MVVRFIFYINTTLLTLAKPYPVLYIWLNTEFLVRFCLNLFLLFPKLLLFRKRWKVGKPSSEAGKWALSANERIHEKNRPYSSKKCSRFQPKMLLT
ncbi:MAG TPA: hypothetical protein DDW85_06895 [Porphyromonadaceae bacterium]|nr:hypothetical protein [Porphyromonadaceae bacterium]